MNEFSIIQNSALGSLALFSFVKEYHYSKDKLEGPTIPLLMPILPIVFNEESNLALSRNQKRLTSYYKTLADCRTIPVGLQKRMEHMYSNTMNSLNIGFATGMLIYNNASAEITPRPRLTLPDLTIAENHSIIQTSSLLGFWFSKLTLEEICISLNIQF
ncbi:three component ABC system middle component [Chryseolinea soli]|uniref:Uncharacterized protein n=1 Tax=Chryseolinea soli TaxID=2321403 RepID=A0A385SL75_9BACT|nr:three component ABC system middle component [Chryseolinea soli]AYB32513.1 hypothetical protein D4L85_18880 [Chryseolinea soli]